MSGRIIAMDYGKRRVGIAVSDPLCIIANGIGTLQNNPGLIKNIQDIIKKYDPEIIVVGMPNNLDGNVGTQAKEVEVFSEKLKGFISTPIEYWDERFTSKIAKDTMIEVGLNKKKRAQKERIDEISAILILQSYLDFKRNKLKVV